MGIYMVHLSLHYPNYSENLSVKNPNHGTPKLLLGLERSSVKQFFRTQLARDKKIFKGIMVDK